MHLTGRRDKLNIIEKIAMRVVIQRVHHASVSVAGKTVGEIDRGLMILVGIETADRAEQVDYCVRKVANARLWSSSDEVDGSASPRARDEWRRSVCDIKGGILVVSQFTLMGNVKKGNKPDFHHAMPPTPARELFDSFVAKLTATAPQGLIQTGSFGEYMKIDMSADGPVTIVLDTALMMAPIVA